MKSAAKNEERPPLVPIHWAELEGRERPPYIVKGVLNDNRFSVVYGEPGVMKTFIAIDLAAHVALNKPWHGQRVRGGPVVYVACEGGGSIEDRLAAFCKRHGVARAGVPLYVLPQAINLGDKVKGDAKRLIEAIKAIGNVKLIVIDTLSRALFGGNENSPDDMGSFVAVCDAVRLATGAHVLIVHHTGKDVERGARGHSSLKAAADTEIVVTKADDVCIVKTTKQRDLADDFEIGFRGHVVEIGEDEDGDPVTSLALEPTDERPAPEDQLPKGAKAALDTLWSAIKGEGVTLIEGEASIPPDHRAIREDRWRELCAAVPLSRGSTSAADKAFRRAKDRLVEDSKIGTDGGWVWPWPKGPAPGAQDDIPF